MRLNLLGELPSEEELFAPRKRFTKVDALGWLLIVVAVLATAAMVSWAMPAHASPLESGNPLPACMPIEQKADAMALAPEKGKVQTFDGATSHKLIDALNNMPPITDWDAAIVDTVTISGSTAPVRVFLTDKKLFCLFAMFTEEKWQVIKDQAFTAPVPAPRGTGI